MMRNLLICAAIDFSGGDWFADVWPAVVGSHREGKAGDIFHARVPGAGLALRADLLPGSERPEIRPLDITIGPDGSYTLLAGRISERADLAAQLAIALPAGDAELYAQACMRMGEGCDAALMGRYAVIQWFAEERRLRLARSPLQAPPLHVWRDGSRVIVASTPRAIFAAGVEPRLDMAHLANAGLLNFRVMERSFYRGFSRVACGGQERHDLHGVHRQRFWSIGQLPEVRLPSREAYVDAASSLLERAVADALSDARQPAISLSGGLDSQLAAATVLKQLGEGSPLRSYTSYPVADWLPRSDERLAYDERPHVDALAARYPNLHPSFVTGEEARFGEDLDRLTRLAAWPTANEMNMHWVHAIHAKAASDGCDVMLHGELGDSSISYEGVTAFAGWLLGGRWQRLWSELGEMDEARPIWRRFASYAVLPILPRWMRISIDRMRGHLKSPFERWSPLDPHHPQTRSALKRALSDGHDVHYHAPHSSHEARAAMIALPVSEGPEVDLGLRLMHGIERRDPFAFRPLWEFCAGLPDELFIRNGMRRWLARELLSKRAPAHIADQSRVAIQSADMLGRMQRDRAQILDEIAMFKSTLPSDHAIDLDRLAAIAEGCNGPRGPGERDWLRVVAQLPRGLALARFAMHVEGRTFG